MKDFAELYRQLDSTTKTNSKIDAMAHYFSSVAAEDAAWATYFLSGNRPKQLVPNKLLRQWAAQVAGIPDWLFEESYQSVGDLAETISLVVPNGTSTDTPSLHLWMQHRLLPLRGMDESHLRDRVIDIWNDTDHSTRFVTMKLITGAFRVGVSKRLVTRAIAKSSNIDVDVIAHRLMGEWEPTAKFFEGVVDPDHLETPISKPYPFCLAHPIDSENGPESLGPPSEFVAEWKWDGIRGQVIRRDDQTFIWSRGEELMEKRWPEIEAAASRLPNGTVIDGEILAVTDEGVLPFSSLQRRIARKTVGKKLLSEVPVRFFAFDLLEQDGVDLRQQSLQQRRLKLDSLLQTINDPTLCSTQTLPTKSWKELAALRETARERRSEGLMLKRLDSSYDVGRVRGTWWKWKVDPMTIDAVLIYAQKGHGKRSSLFTDYTFALWRGDQLVPFAKAYSGLSDAEIREVDRYVRANIKESFGPVRSVTPALVMELAFEGIQRSKRHKSGVATRFPRIVRWRRDKSVTDANTLEELLSWLPEE